MLSFSHTCSHALSHVSAPARQHNPWPAVERMVEYGPEPEEAAAVIPGRRPPASWPSEGGLAVVQLVVRYRPELPPVLRGLTFNVAPREKLGVCGRTGARALLLLRCKRAPAAACLHVRRRARSSAPRIRRCMPAFGSCKAGCVLLRSHLTAPSPPRAAAAQAAARAR